MSNSPLVSYTLISPNRSSPRNEPIDRITIHCVVGQITVESLGALFYQPNRQASSNYGIGKDGKIGLYVEEKDRSWCTSSRANDNRAITIEVASETYSPYAVNAAAYASLLDLCTDICKRNGKSKLLWIGEKNATLSYVPKSDEMVLTVHRWFANKSCPGDWLFVRHGMIAKEVTQRLKEDSLSDIKGHWAEDAIRWAVDKGIIKGYTDGTFKPENTVSRAELVTILKRLEECK